MTIGMQCWRVGRADRTTGLEMEFNGSRHHPLSATMAAHKSHGELMFGEEMLKMTMEDFEASTFDEKVNCEVELREWNFVKTSREEVAMKAAVEASRPAVVELLKRIRSLQVPSSLLTAISSV